MRTTGKGLPPHCATYITGSDHRRQVEAADVRLAKRHDIKARRRLDVAAVAEDESAPVDVIPAPVFRDHTYQKR